MPPLEIHKQELFAQALAQHGHMTRAAIEAGYSTKGAGVAGSRLAAKPKVKQRIMELQRDNREKVQRAVVADRAWVLNSLVANAEDALKAKDRSAANRALELVGKELGMFIERKMDLKSPLDGLSADDLLAIVRLAEQVEGGAPVPVLANPESLSAPVEMIDVSPPTIDLEAVNVPIEDEDDAI
jgi:hypothetical protein